VTGILFGLTFASLASAALLNLVSFYLKSLVLYLTQLGNRLHILKWCHCKVIYSNMTITLS